MLLGEMARSGERRLASDSIGSSKHPNVISIGAFEAGLMLVGLKARSLAVLHCYCTGCYLRRRVQ